MLPNLEQTRDGSPTLFSPAYQQTYHSRHGAITESRHVFLAESGVQARLTQGQATRVLEVGFGTGLNFFLTAQLSQQYNTPLTYVALEKNLLPAKLLAQLPFDEPLAGLQHRFVTWRAQYPDEPPDDALHWQVSPQLTLKLILGDATTVSLPEWSYHAVYHDAFSPDANPELWQAEFFARIKTTMAVGSRLTTYSAKGSVRRTLQDVGFQVEKRPGPPGKREMLVAHATAFSQP